MAAQRLKLGRYFGIELFVHWTFGLLVAYVAYSTLAQGGSIWMVAFSVSLLLAVFLCVTLHEYGHSLAARQFGVETVDITLLPIGGVARLRRIPRVPLQELVIAVAGPAVNVVIATVLGTALAFLVGFGPLFDVTLESMGFEAQNAATETTQPIESNAGDGDQQAMQAEEVGDVSELPLVSAVLSFAVFVVAINVWLVLFNLIPAFPMDGGRVLRSLLAMILPYGSATRWAQRIGVVCGMLMAMFAISADPIRWPMLAIAAFIVYAGRMEAQQVELSDQLAGLRISDVMIRRPPAVSMDWNLARLQQWWQDEPSSAAAVVGMGNVVVGVVTLRKLAQQIASSPDGEIPWHHLTVDQIADHNVPPLHASMMLESAMGGLQHFRQLPVVDENYHLVGWQELDTLMIRAALARASRLNQVDEPSAAKQPADYLFEL